MLPIKKILHPTDFSEGAAAAFDHALHLARHHEAELHLLHVVPTFGGDPIMGAFEAAIDSNAFVQELWDEAETQMRDLVETHQHRDVPLRHVLARGAAAGPIILDYAVAEAVDVIVMGTHGRRGAKHVLLGSVAEEVVHQAPCPVLTVRQQKGLGDEARPIQRILVPIDFSEHAAPLLQTAKEMAASYSAQLHLLHVITPIPFTVSLMTPISIQELVPGITEKTRARLEELFQGTPGPDVPVEVHVRGGHPARTIIEVSEEQRADLIIIAPRGLTGLDRFFLGSVAERVVRTAFCPVLLAKTEVPAASNGVAEAAATAAPLASEKAVG